jgi:hypothetical protein
VINEIMYNPYESWPASQPFPSTNATQYVELYNVGTSVVDLTQFRFDTGITFSFTNGTLGPQSLLVVCEDVASFLAAYPTVTNVVGNFSGSLDNAGERVTLSRLVDGNWVTADTIKYFDDDSSDGTGRSLELVHPGFARMRNQSFTDWVASASTNGSPGRTNAMYRSNPTPIVADVTPDTALPPAGSNSAVKITARITGRDGDAMSSVSLEYRKDANPQGLYTNTPMIDTGLGGDAIAGDGVYTAYLPPYDSGMVMANGEMLEFRIRATDNVGTSPYFPATNRASARAGAYSYLVKFGEESHSGEAYPGEYPTYHMLMNKVNRDQLQLPANIQNQIPWDATIVLPDDTVVYNSSVRLRGSGSRVSTLGNYRINLPSGVLFEEFDELNLNHEYALAQFMGMDVTARSGAMASDVALSRVYLNEELKNPGQGIYCRVEGVDGSYIDRHIGDTDIQGNVYNTTGADGAESRYGDLTFNSSVSWYPSQYLISLNNPNTAWYALQDLTSYLTNVVNGEVRNITNRVSVTNWGKIYAASVAVDNSEYGYYAISGGADELRTYDDPYSRQFLMMPWDYSDALGMGASDGTVGSIWGFSFTVIPSFLYNRPILPIYLGGLVDVVTDTMSDANMAAMFTRMGSKMSAINRQNVSNDVVGIRASVMSQIFTNITVTGLPDGARTLTVPTTNMGQNVSAVIDQNHSPAQWFPVGAINVPPAGGGSVTLTRIRPQPITETIADAIMFSNTITGASVILDDGQSGFGVTGTWTTSPTGGYAGGGFRYSTTGGSTSTWAPPSLPSGSYQIYAWLFVSPISVDGSETGARYDLIGGQPHVVLTSLTGRGPQNYTQRMAVNDNPVNWNIRANGNLGAWSVTNSIAIAGEVVDVVVRAVDLDNNTLKSFSFKAIGRRSPTVVQGTIASPTTWSSGSGIVLVTNNVTVNSGITLAVDPGTVVLFSPGTRLTVNGTLDVRGTATAPVQILPEGGTNVWSIRASGASSVVAISNAVMLQGSIAVDSGATLRLIDSTISGSYDTNGIVSASGASSALLLRTIVRDFNRTRFATTPTLIDQSLFERMTAVGIDMVGTASTSTVRRTTLREPLGTDGIRFINATAGLVTNTWISAMSGTGIVASASILAIVDSLLTDCDSAIALTAGSTTTRNLTIEDGRVGITGAPTVTNLILRDVDQAFVTGPATVGFSNVELPAYAIPAGPGNMNRKAFFRDSSEADYQLLPTSPCIGTGLGGVNMGAPYPVGANPIAPANLHIATTDSNSITLAWQDLSTDESGFEIFRREIDNNDWLLAGIAASGSTNFTDAPLPQNTEYAYRVRAFHPRGASTYSDEATATTTFQAYTEVLREFLRITEVHYNPSGSADDTEFIEYKNISTNLTLDLSGCYADNGRWTFTNGTTLAPQAFFILARNYTAFHAAYPSIAVRGTFLIDDKLDNAGETIYVRDAAGADIVNFTYSDDPTDWYPATDGNGFTLVPVDPNPSGDANAPLYWRASANPNGSPGADDPEPAGSGIVVNEVLAHADDPFEDAIELRNIGTNTVNITGWYLSDNPDNLKQYLIPATAPLAPGAFKVFYEGTSFNQNPGGPGNFAISEFGEDVYLSAAVGGNLTGYRTVGTLRKAIENGVSFGRYIRSDGQVDFTALSNRTFGVDYPAPTSIPHFRTGGGLPNAGPKVGPVVINEIMYNPAAGGKEFIEILNSSPSTVYFGDQGSVWEFDDAVEFKFPTAGSLAPGELALVVGSDPTEFRQLFSIPPSIQIFGPFTGALNNAGEPIELCKPGAYDVQLGAAPTVMVERVRYNNNAPWPTAANNDGASLERINPHRYGNDPTNWVAGTIGGTPGTVNNTSGLPTLGFLDVHSDGRETNEVRYIEVTLSPAGASTVTVQYAASGGTASTNDYSLNPGTLTFWPYETSKSIALTIINDITPAGEPDETVLITLSNASPNALLGGNRVFVHEIRDDDAVNLPPPVILPSTSRSFLYRLDVSMTPTVAGSTIRYTLNDTLPTESSPVYTGPFWLYSSTKVIARTFLGSYNVGAWTSVVFSAQSMPRDYEPNLPTNTVELPVRASSDDGAQFSNGRMMGLTLPTIRLGEVGASAALFRFYPTRDGIPMGATVTNAFIQFTAAEASSGTPTVTIRGQAIDQALTLGTGNNNITARPLTTAAIPWTPTDWVLGDRNAAQRTPNIAAAIHEIVNRPGWHPTNALAVVFNFTTPSGFRSVHSFDGSMDYCALLHVEWSESNAVSEFYFGVSTNGAGAVTGGNLWVPANAYTSATAHADLPLLFSHWSGNVGAANTNASTLVVLMDQDRDVTANFVLAQPEPPHILAVPAATGSSFTLRWDSQAPYTYSVTRLTNLLWGWDGNSAILTSDMPAHVSGTNEFTDTTSPSPGGFYSIGADLPAP